MASPPRDLSGGEGGSRESSVAPSSAAEDVVFSDAMERQQTNELLESMAAGETAYNDAEYVPDGDEDEDSEFDVDDDDDEEEDGDYIDEYEDDDGLFIDVDDEGGGGEEGEEEGEDSDDEQVIDIATILRAAAQQAAQGELGGTNAGGGNGTTAARATAALNGIGLEGLRRLLNTGRLQVRRVAADEDDDDDDDEDGVRVRLGENTVFPFIHDHLAD